MAFQSLLPCFLLLSSLFSSLTSSSQAYKFYVGGNQGWVSNPSENYSHWAERNRFQVNDTLYFKYKKGSDSVLVVNKNDYDNCNTKNPTQKLEDGDSEFKFDRSGPFFFISGKNCDKGQKLIVVVLAVRPPKHSTPSPAISPPPGAHPPVASPPTGSRPTSPFPSPAITPVPGPSSKSPAPAPLSSAPTGSPALAPSSPSPSSHARTGSPVLPPSPSLTPSSSPSPASHAPTGSPVPSSSSPTNSPAEAPASLSPPSSEPSPPTLSPAQPTPTPTGTGASPPGSGNQVSPSESIAVTIIPSSLMVSWFTILVSVVLLSKN
ncbi:Phytocyanin domain containing protein [Parasponia andersonii]|uniref:Phytocyanin domain containing protein n=1 Tax=Parasponia andersonii TaxID=3476 RepID=A0A2P5AU47_PARAD|nr:Phytocyanin domain containing protein [Parasponia andersonii]